MFMKHSALALAALLLSAGASAQVGVTADLGTTGAGVHLVVPMETYLNGRFGVNAFEHDFDHTTHGLAYNVKGKLQTVDVLFDWYLHEGGPFHVTGGLVYNGNRFDASAKANGAGQYTLNGNTYAASAVGTLNGRVDYRKAAPYIGIGWGNALSASGKWQFNGDLGAFYQGNANVKLADSGCTAGTAVCTAVATDVAAERQRLRDDVSSFKFYPVLRASVSYHF